MHRANVVIHRNHRHRKAKAQAAYLADPAFAERGNVAIREGNQVYYAPDEQQMQRKCAAIRATRLSAVTPGDGGTEAVKEDADETEDYGA